MTTDSCCCPSSWRFALPCAPMSRAAQIETAGGDRSARLTAEARSYFDLALSLLEDRPVEFIAIGGLSGSGKSTVAEALAAHVGAPPGARVVESDRIRKAMHGVAAETRLPAKAYRAEVSEKVYREMAWRARLILADGGSVVVDAVFDAPRNRQLIEQVALDLGVPFRGIWLDASPSLLIAPRDRTHGRRVGRQCRRPGKSDRTWRRRGRHGGTWMRANRSPTWCGKSATRAGRRLPPVRSSCEFQPGDAKARLAG